MENKILEERKFKCELAKSKGVTANIQTGEIFGIKGNLIISKRTDGYIQFNIRKENKRYTLKGHQFIWYLATGEVVDCIDHINRDRSDNRISNLRSVTKKTNSQNTLGKGCTWKEKLQKFEAKIKVNYKSISLGVYDTFEEANKVYLEAKNKYHNEY